MHGTYLFKRDVLCVQRQRQVRHVGNAERQIATPRRPRSSNPSLLAVSSAASTTVSFSVPPSSYVSSSAPLFVPPVSVPTHSNPPVSFACLIQPPACSIAPLPTCHLFSR